MITHKWSHNFCRMFYLSQFSLLFFFFNSHSSFLWTTKIQKYKTRKIHPRFTGDHFRVSNLLILFLSSRNNIVVQFYYFISTSHFFLFLPEYSFRRFERVAKHQTPDCRVRNEPKIWEVNSMCVCTNGIYSKLNTKIIMFFFTHTNGSSCSLSRVNEDTLKRTYKMNERADRQSECSTTQRNNSHRTKSKCCESFATKVSFCACWLQHRYKRTRGSTHSHFTYTPAARASLPYIDVWVRAPA